MARKIEINITAKDNVSRPATMASRSIERVKRSFQSVSSIASKGFNNVSSFMKNASSKLNSFGDNFKGALDKAAGGFVAFKGASAVLVGMFSIGRDLIEQQQKLADVSRVYKGSPEAEASLKRILKFASESGIALEDATKIASRLGSSFDPSTAETLFKTLQDAKYEANLTTGQVDQLAEHFVKLGSKVNVGLGDIEAFGAAGAKMVPTYAQIGKAIGKTADEAQALAKSGQLSAKGLADAFVLARKEAAGTTLAGAGAIDAASGSISAQITNMTTKYDLFKATLSEKLFGNTEDQAKAFKKFGDIVGRAFGFIIDNMDTIKPILVVVAGLMAGLAVALGVVGTIAAVSILAPFAAIIAIIGGVVTAITLVITYWSKLSDVFGGIGEIMGGLIERFTSFGSEIIQGLINGILGSAGNAINAIKGVADSLVGGFKSVLGIASPSKVFGDLADNTVEGFTQGSEKGEAAMSSSGSGLGNAVAGGAKNSLQSAAGGSASAGGSAGPMSGGPSITLGSITVNIDGSSQLSEQKLAQEFQRSARLVLMDIMSSMQSSTPGY